MNAAEVLPDEDDDEHVIFSAKCTKNPQIIFDSSEEGQNFNFTNEDVFNTDEYDTPILYYDWLANSATTFHVCNRHEAFTDFTPLTATKVTGIGNLSMTAQGQGTLD